MKMASKRSLFFTILATIVVSGAITQVKAFDPRFDTVYPDSSYCAPWSRCPSQYLECPSECPKSHSYIPNSRVCRIDCDNPKCSAECVRKYTPDCGGPGSACGDPRFIGGDNIVFYFHGKVNEQFSLVSDSHLQINGRFIGHQPTGRSRPFTWIQALGLLFNSHTFSLEATKSATWDGGMDHLKLSYNGEEISLAVGALSSWKSPEGGIEVERTTAVNSVIVNIPGVVEILAKVVPVTAEDDKIHGYKVPSDDCFDHLEVQFKFNGLSDDVEGVLGRTYQPDFKNPAKPGVAMAVVGGEDNYRTTSLLTSDCPKCIYDSSNVVEKEKQMIKEHGTLDCSAKGLLHGNGIVCKK